MSNQIQTQAAKVWETIAAPETGSTYQKTGSLTWAILKETGYLLWLVLCIGLVAGEWIWKTGYRTGYGFRDWLNNFERPSPDRLLSATGQSLLDVSKTGMSAVLSTAKNQLGIEPDPEPIAPPVVSAPPAPAAPAPLPTETASKGAEATKPINPPAR
jgi:hypothetical protein